MPYTDNTIRTQQLDGFFTDIYDKAKDVVNDTIKGGKDAGEKSIIDNTFGPSGTTTNQGSPTNPNLPQPVQQEKSNTLTYLAIGGAAIVGIIIIAKIAKHSKKSKTMSGLKKRKKHVGF